MAAFSLTLDSSGQGYPKVCAAWSELRPMNKHASEVKHLPSRPIYIEYNRPKPNPNILTFTPIKNKQVL